MCVSRWSVLSIHW